MPYAIDLFCGAGGMSEGIIQAGFDILFSNDINEQVQLTYTNRHHQLGLIQGYNTFFYKGDIRDISGKLINSCISNLKIFKDGIKELPKDIDVIFGGPPCQGFSRAGKRDACDPRNFLFKEYVRVIGEVKPKYVVMENVEGFVDTMLDGYEDLNGKTHLENCYAPVILKHELTNIGYNVLEPKVLDASDFGVPQRRNRVIFMAYRNDCAAPSYPIPNVNKKVTILEAIGDLIRDNELKKQINPTLTNYQLESIKGRTPTNTGDTLSSNNVVNNNELSKHSNIISERFSLFQEGEKGTELRKRLKINGIDISKTLNLLTKCSEELQMDKKTVIEVYKNGNLDDKLLDILLF